MPYRMAAIAVWIAVVGVVPTDAQITYLNTRQIVLSFELAAGVPVEQVQVWVSHDNGRTWDSTPARRQESHSVVLEASQDGCYAYYGRLVNDAGASGEAPEAGAKPHAVIVVDTAPPTLQVHAVRTLRDVQGGRRLELLATLVDEHLGREALRVLYRPAEGGTWQDGGGVESQGQAIVWRVPAELVGKIDLRLVATDLAGNRAEEELLAVNLSDPVEADRSVETEAMAQPASKPVPVDGLEAEGASGACPRPSAGRPAKPAALPTDPWEVARLRELAERFSAQGKLGLAGARLEDALKLAPEDPTLLVDLGSVLFRCRRYNDAERLFSQARELSPQHVGALEGLALVAATQCRYADARDRLRELLEFTPQDGRQWLRYGDVEHRLGESDAASQAWWRALEWAGQDASLRAKAEKRLRLLAKDNELLETRREKLDAPNPNE